MRLFQRSLLLLAFALAAPGARAQAPAPTPAPASAPAPADAAPRLGSGAHTYEWVAGAFAPPEGTEWGNTHGEIVVDRNGLLHISFDTAPAIRTFRPDGTFVSAWDHGLANGVHGMTLAAEAIESADSAGEPGGGNAPEVRELLYFVHTNRNAWAKVSLDGVSVLLSCSAPMESGKYENIGQFKPTSIAVAPDGSIFVADGYGQHWIHKYDAQGKWLACFGGPGEEVGQLNCPHGLCIDTRGAPETVPTLLVADRENHRIQRFDLDGKPLGVIAQAPDLRRPCKLQLRGSDLVIPDLCGRVTILGADNAVLAQLGDNPDESQRAENGVPKDKWVDGVFLAPHSAAWDADGNLYVMDWNHWGRLSKLARLPGP